MLKAASPRGKTEQLGKRLKMVAALQASEYLQLVSRRTSFEELMSSHNRMDSLVLDRSQR